MYSKPFLKPPFSFCESYVLVYLQITIIAGKLLQCTSYFWIMLRMLQNVLTRSDERF